LSPVYGILLMQHGTEEVVEVIRNDLLMGPLNSATSIFQTGYEVLLFAAICFEVKKIGYMHLLL
jgi:hypothetical protein